MNLRDIFVEHFGNDQALKIEDAARGHETSANSENKGSDEFRWAMLVCIGYQCMKKESYRGHHGITVPWEELVAFMQLNISTHDGDIDYLGMAAGFYKDVFPLGFRKNEVTA